VSTDGTVPSAPARRRWRFGTIVWALLPLLTWSLLAPVPFVHAAVRLRSWRLWLVAAAYTIVWGAVGPLEVVTSTAQVDSDAVLGFSQLGLVVTATAFAFAVRERVFPAPVPMPALAAEPVVAAALAARQRREQARAITVRDLALARELSIGRPDLPRQFDDGGLVDINHVPVEILVDRLDLSPSEAGQVVDARERLGGFTSPAELAAFTELPEATVAALGDRLLFLGQRPSAQGVDP
jgi:hypothetical protein